jgi:myo-inositol-1(or 4)-monophosphatase
MSSYSQQIQIAIKTGKKAGKLLLKQFKSRLKVEGMNKGVTDIVTQADIDAEKLISEELGNNFPQSKIISEEVDINLEHSSNTLKDAWVIDPLDGTRNFSIGNPNFVISIGYVNERSEFEGVVHFPILDQTFIATEHKSFLVEKELSVSNTEQLKNSIVAFWDKREKDPNWSQPEIYNALRGKTKVLRVFGASALEKTWVSTGQIDLYIGNSSSIFGAVAGVALVRNSGGVCYNLEGSDWQLGDVGIICGNKILVEQALKELI